eukprot:TRINITY_DN61796_c0_g1_i1.p1 TRINITY_DN61796_c0_g1~~TRINITY_DN61796_c0_g1_i1.p1  ORF type:complete len:581 (+),score=107.92 TRINITY_DN61796_c0_g1_i1:42-1784(+)
MPSRGRAEFLCARPGCPFLTHSDHGMGDYCCKQCHAKHLRPRRSLEHGSKCEGRLPQQAGESVPRASGRPPRVPLVGKPEPQQPSLPPPQLRAQVDVVEDDSESQESSFDVISEDGAGSPQLYSDDSEEPAAKPVAKEPTPPSRRPPPPPRLLSKMHLNESCLDIFFADWLQKLRSDFDIPDEALLALADEGLSKQADFTHRFTSEEEVGRWCDERNLEGLAMTRLRQAWVHCREEAAQANRGIKQYRLEGSSGASKSTASNDGSKRGLELDEPASHSRESNLSSVDERPVLRPTSKLKAHKPTKNLVEELSLQEKMVQAQKQLLTAAPEEQLLQEELAQTEPLSTQHLQEQLPQDEERQRSAQQSVPKASSPWSEELIWTTPSEHNDVDGQEEPGKQSLQDETQRRELQPKRVPCPPTTPPPSHLLRRASNDGCVTAIAEKVTEGVWQLAFQRKRVAVDVLRYTQLGCSPAFLDGLKTLKQTAFEIAEGSASIDEEWCELRVMRKNGMLWSMDNRRLWALKEAQRLRRCQNPEAVIEVNIKLFIWDPAFEVFWCHADHACTPQDGLSIKVRGESYHRTW